MNQNKKFGKTYTVYHFVQEGEARSTIFRLINRYESGISAIVQNGRGRKPKILTEETKKQIIKISKNKNGVSQPALARMFECSQPHINKFLKNTARLKCYKKYKIPKRTELQREKGREKCSTLYRKYKKFNFIMDDESYFTQSHSTINGNNHYYSNDKNLVSPKVRYRMVKKFEPKLLVWIAISRFGISKPLIRKSGLAIDKETYIEECLEERLIPFIRKHHKDDDYVFWPDLASAHYARDTIDYLIEKGINHVDKEENPANLPEVRPIEKFWGVLKGRVYKNNWQAKNLVELEKRIRMCLDEFDPSTIQTIMSGVSKKLDYVRRNNIIELRHK